VRDGVEFLEDMSDEVLRSIDRLELDALVVVGGDGTLRISKELFDKGCPIVGVPKTIDNDVGGTDASFGFDTAIGIATEAIDRLHTTAESHHRAMFLELMGRDAGFITLHAGVAGGADVILIPELPFSYDSVCEKILSRAQGGRHFSIAAVAEGASPLGGQQAFSNRGDEIYAARLGGITQNIVEYVAENCKVECRVTVLGHLQRGGSPTPFDRFLATRFGAAAVRLAEKKYFGRMVALHGTVIGDISLADALGIPKRVDLSGDAIMTARELGICLGD
jgi:ATP-dependent phosphofructokinase / diphosphate-dependent phosphofructokinase